MSVPLSIAVGCVFVQVALTFWAIIRMGFSRIDAIRTHKIPMATVALGSDAYPLDVKLMQANAHNQFETPPVFYAGVAFAAILGAANWGVALASVAYVAFRILHRYVHVTSNHVSTRFTLFVAGLGSLALLWISLGIGLIL